MIVVVDTDRTRLEVLEREQLGKLAVQVTGPKAQVDALLGPLGRLEGDHAWLRVDELRRRARPLDARDSWDEQFDAMVRFAAEHGWTDAEQRFVRAHLMPRQHEQEEE